MWQRDDRGALEIEQIGFILDNTGRTMDSDGILSSRSRGEVILIPRSWEGWIDTFSGTLHGNGTLTMVLPKENEMPKLEINSTVSRYHYSFFLLGLSYTEILLEAE